MLGRKQRVGDILIRSLLLLIAAAACLTCVACGSHTASGDAVTIPPPAAPPTTAAQASAPPTVATTTAPATTAAATAAAIPTAPAPTTAAPAKPAVRTILSSADRASFARLQAKLGGTIGLAVSGVGRDRHVEETGSLRSAIAWSTSKAPIAMAIYDAGLASAQSANLRAAITASDNTAAQNLWDALGSGTHAAAAADHELRAAGDDTTEIQPRVLRSGFTAFGQTTWTLANQTRFVAGMGCTRSGLSVLALMQQVISSQRWGLGTIGDHPALKGGWGPGTVPGVNSGYLDRQMGVVPISGHLVALSIASLPADGSHDTGTRNLTAIAQWARTHLDVRDLPRSYAAC